MKVFDSERRVELLAWTFGPICGDQRTIRLSRTLCEENSQTRKGRQNDSIGGTWPEIVVVSVVLYLSETRPVLVGWFGGRLQLK